ncbi:MAG: WD40 repeat domain-containing protein [Saprospiraceae bacterium]|nr:WD40 repeat domain-containing protein [Saprospiraceae bacterium]
MFVEYMSRAPSIIKEHQLTGHKAAVFALGAGSSPRHFLSGAGDGWIVDWDLDDPETGKLIAQVESRIFSLCYLREKDLVLAGNMNGGLHWIDLEDPSRTRNIAHHEKGVFALLRLGEYVYSAGGQGMLTRWSIGERRSLESVKLSHTSLRALDYSPGRHEFAVGSSDNSIYLLDADSLEVRSAIPEAHENSVFSLKYQPDADRLWSGGRDAHLRVWELEGTPRLLKSLPAHWYTVNALALSPGGEWLATASRDKTIKIWDLASLELRKVLKAGRDGGHINSVNCLFWTDYGHSLISGSDDRSLIIWKAGDFRA